MDDKNAERLPPQSIGAEKCLLGALLRDNSLLADVQAVIRGKEDFYLYAHQLVWDGICSHAEKGKPFDPRIIADWLNEKKAVEDVGYSYLAELWDAAPSAGNAVHYAETVQDRATRRRLIHIGNEVASRGFNLNEPISTIAQAIEQKLFAATQQSFKTNLRSIKDSMKDTLELIADLIGQKVSFVEDPLRIRPAGSEVHRLCCDSSKMTKLTGHQPENSLKDGLKKTIDWFAKAENLQKYKAGIYNV